MATAISLLYICSILSLFTNNVAAAPPSFSSILIFGDSLLDTGNNNYIPTLLRANHAPYGISFPGGVPTGRFSDGKLMSDFLAEALGIKDTVPPFLDPNLGPNDIRTGVCFASAGSGYDDFTAFVSGVIPVTKQYNEYFQTYKRKLVGIVGEQQAVSILNNSFVFATSGSNDMTISFYSGAPRRLEYTLDQYQDFLLRRIQNFIKKLYEEGLRNMAIAGLPPLGCGPLQRQKFFHTCSASMNMDSEKYNKKLIAMLAILQTSLPGSRLVYVDIYTPLQDLARNALNYGISVPFGACCGNGITDFGDSCNSLTPTCLNPSQYMFFDAIHPTQVTYRYMTKWYIQNLLPQFSHT